jgi:hypothetical protein
VFFCQGGHGIWILFGSLHLHFRCILSWTQDHKQALDHMYEEREARYLGNADEMIRRCCATGMVGRPLELTS